MQVNAEIPTMLLTNRVNFKLDGTSVTGFFLLIKMIGIESIKFPIVRTRHKSITSTYFSFVAYLAKD